MKKKLILFFILIPFISNAQSTTFKKAPSVEVQTSSVQAAFDEYEGKEIKKFLERTPKDKDKDIPNRVYKGLHCIENCENDTGYVDIIILAP